MARKKNYPTLHHCKDCIHHYNEHTIAHDTGKPFMCQCWLHRRRHRFMAKDACEDYNRRDAEVMAALKALMDACPPGDEFGETLALIRNHIESQRSGIPV